MAKVFRVTLPCPECGEQNRFITKPSNRFDLKTEKVQCFNGETQKGCMKFFNLNQQINLWTQKLVPVPAVPMGILEKIKAGENDNNSNQINPNN